MVLPSSGLLTAQMINVELGRNATDPFSIDGAAERKLAGKPTGAISFSDFYGKANEIIVFATSADVGKDRMDLFFSEEDWSSDTAKRLVITSGTDFGSTTYGHSLAIGRTAGGQAESFVGDLTLELEAGSFLSGRGGAANGGAGGIALYANLLGRNGQKLKVINNGTIRGGGGGGGKGGTGGGGSVPTTIREPATGFTFSARSPATMWYNGQGRIFWESVRIVDNNQNVRNRVPVTIGEWTWLPGQVHTPTHSWLARQKAGPATNTNGGAGGNGGVGQGIGQNAGAGANGAAGGQNAGTGGKGGNGGAYGSNGAAGVAGANGNRTNGAAGAAGGLAGFYCSDNSAVEWIVEGTRQGRAG